MKVAIFVKQFPTVTETFILNQITGLIDRNIDVTIYSFNENKLPVIHHSIINKYKLLEKTVYLNAVPKNKIIRIINIFKLVLEFKNVSIIKKAFKACNVFRYGRQAVTLYLASILYLLRRAPKYDIIHCQFGDVAPQILRFKEIGAIEGKVVTSFRGNDASVHLSNDNGYYRELFTKGDFFLPVCNYLRSNLIENGCNSNKTVVLHSGIDVKKLVYSKRIPHKKVVTHIATISRLVEKKGVRYGILAVQKLMQSGREVKYTVIGDGKLRTELDTFIKEQNLDEYIKIVGWKTQDELITFLKDVHILVAPSVTPANGDKEGIPNILKEAMAMGIPVVTTDHGGIPELVQDGISGFIVPERDIDALADRIAYLIDHPELWPVFGSAGRLKIENEFDINILNDRLVEIYRWVINGDSLHNDMLKR